MAPRGFLSAELGQYLLLISLLSLLVTPLARYGNQLLSAWHIERTVHRLIDKSQQHYAKSVLMSRCLPQTRLSMQVLGEVAQQDGVTYGVSYRQSGVPRTPPSAIVVSVILDQSMKGLINLFQADVIQGATLQFYAPLRFTLPDFQQLNIETGCIL